VRDAPADQILGLLRPCVHQLIGLSEANRDSRGPKPIEDVQ
jgi:hypothetical protein